MDRSYPYSRRLLARARLHKRMAAVAAMAMVGASALLTLAWTPDPIAGAMAPAALQLARADGPATVRGVRRIYPYSVIPGGVSGQAELKRVIRTDRVVAAHYATFDVDKARPVAALKPRDVYVSYRKGGQVFWTAHKVRLAEGETLLSDGRNEMRARCANRISDVAQYPVEPHHPVMDELDEAIALDPGEEYALGADGLPVSSAGMARLGGQRSPNGGGSGIKAPSPTGQLDALLASASASPGMGIGAAPGLSASSSSTGSRPRPADTSAPGAASSSPAASHDSSAPEGSGGDASGTEPSLGGGSDPASLPEGGTGLAPATTTPSSGGTRDTITQPGTDTYLPPVVTGEPQGGGGGAETLIPKPDLKPPAPQESVEEPKAPAAVPEPGSIWLFGAALAALAALRRRVRVKPRS